MRHLQIHRVESFATVRIFPKMRYPIADAHRRNTMREMEGHRHQSD
jgi:hypothetical protein